MCECAAASFDALRGKQCCAAIVRMRTDRLMDAYRLSVYRKPEVHKKVAEGVLGFDYIWHENLNETVPGLTELVKKDC